MHARPVLPRLPNYPPLPSTSQQAVQWLPPNTIYRSDELVLEASHDTYGISFQQLLPSARPAVSHPKSTSRGQLSDAQQQDASEHDPLPAAAAPLFDPAWASCYAAMQPLSAAMSKALAQDPLEYRRMAQAAVALAARPQDHGVDAAAAAGFLCRMMSV